MVRVTKMQRILLLLISVSVCLLSPVDAAMTLIPAPPRINASSYLVMDYHSGRLLVNENADKRVEPASLTKIMTVYIAAKELAAGNIKLDDKVHVSEKAWRMTGSSMFIEVNKQVTVEELLYGIIIQSGNDASVALAEYIAGDEDVFAQVMNQQAKELGMVNTNFVNSTGMPHADHYTTAMDMAVLARALIRDHPEAYAMHSMKEFTYNGIKQTNRNSMLWRDESVDGVKTGHTKTAGFCLVASAKRGDMRLISVVMGTQGDNARINMTQALLSYAFRFFETHKLYTANQVIQTGRIWKGDRESVDLGVNQDLYITIPKGTYKQLDASIVLDPTIIAPVSAGEVKGTLKVKLEDQELVSQPLMTLQSVGPGGVLDRLKDDVKLLFE